MRKNILKQIGILTVLVLFLLISWGTVASAVVLTVNSSHDTPNPAVGNHDYVVGEVVTCSVTSPADEAAGTKYICTGWTGTGSVFPSTGTDTSVTFTMNVDSTITWNWKTQYKLTTNVNPSDSGGTIIPESGSWQDEGEITVTATPGSGYVFSEWTDDLSGTDNPATLNMDAPKIVTANFVPGYTLTVTSAHDSCTPDVGSHDYTSGSSVTCSVTSPVSGGTGIQYVCTGYTLDGNTVLDSTSVNVIMNQNHTLTWTWKTQYQLTTVINPDGGGSVTLDPVFEGNWYDEAAVVTLTAVPVAGYSFIDWSGDLSGTDNPAALNMDGPKTVTANFGHTPPTGATEPGSDVVLDGCLDVFVDGDGITTPGTGTQDTTISPNASLVHFKTTDNVCWCDADHSNTWATITGVEDSLWIDANGNEKYDSGENVIVDSPVVGAAGMTLTSDYNFAYVDADISGNYTSEGGDDIYYEGGEGNWYLHYSPGKYTIEYNANDDDGGELTLTLYADTDQDSASFAFTIRTHTITSPFPANITYDWDITDVTHGSYYICLKIDDGTSASPVYIYSDGKITINSYPYIKVSNPATDILVWDDYTINFVASDSDDDPLITLYYDDDNDDYNDGFAGTIATGLHKTDTSCVWDISSVPKNVPYYICAKISDSQDRGPYYSYSKGSVTCIDEPELKLSVTSTHTTIDLSWTALTPSPTILNLYRGIYRNGAFVQFYWDDAWHDYERIGLSTTSATSYQDTAYPPEGGTTTNYEDRIYYYIVASYTDDLYGPFTSNTVNEMLIPFPPEEVPTDLEAISGINVVTLSWNDNSINETGFYIERKKKGPDHFYTYIGNATTGSMHYDDGTITAGESYYYRIRAYKTYPDTGNTKAAEYSNEASIDTIPPLGGEGGGSCFIATSAYGTPMAKEIRALCKFRDEYLLTNRPGKAFVRFYYKHSPPIADFIRNKPILKAIVRTGLRPLVWFSKIITNDSFSLVQTTTFQNIESILNLLEEKINTDIAEAALAIARGIDPNTDISKSLRQIDKMADDLRKNL